MQSLDERLKAFPVLHGGAVGELDSQAFLIAAPDHPANIGADLRQLEHHSNPGAFPDWPWRFQIASAQTNIPQLNQDRRVGGCFPQHYRRSKNEPRFHNDWFRSHGL
jgi:hypothetical protein